MGYVEIRKVNISTCSYGVLFPISFGIFVI